MNRGAIAILLYAALTAAVLGAEPQNPAGQEQPHKSLVPGYDDSFLQKREWKAGRDYYRDELLKLLAEKKFDMAPALRLFYAYNVCELFPAIGQGVPSDQAESFTQWLLQYPELVLPLTTSVRPEDNKAGVFRVLHLLKTKLPLREPVAPNLMVAFAVVHDAKPNDEKTNTAILEEFRYYVRNAKKLRYTLNDVPVFLLKYVVDNETSSEEREWVLGQYGASTALKTLYFSIAYDTERYEKGDSPKHQMLLKAGYTLPNIRRYGGICVDQAYFATRVYKCLGIPAAVFVARGSMSGSGHAWATAARPRSDGWNWEWTGRYGGEKEYHVGKSDDPQTGNTITDRDCWLETQLTRVPESKRLESYFFLTAARLMDEAKNTQRAAELLELSVESNPYYADAWLTVAKFCSQKKLKTETAWRLYLAMSKQFREYPQFTGQVRKELLNLIPENDVRSRVKLYDTALELCPRDFPDVAADLQAEKADYLASQGQVPAAVNIYQAAVIRYRDDGPVVEKLLRQAEKIYRQNKKIEDFIPLVEQVFDRYRTRTYSGEWEAVAASTTYGQLAAKLRDLYTEIGNKKKADEYGAKLKTKQ